jgi:hypothetical protein
MNFKVLYIGRENDVVLTNFLVHFVYFVAFRVEWGIMNGYKWLILNDTCICEPKAPNLFMAKVNI